MDCMKMLFCHKILIIILTVNMSIDCIVKDTKKQEIHNRQDRSSHHYLAMSEKRQLAYIVTDGGAKEKEIHGQKK